MASLLGKSYFVLECSPEIAYSTLTQLLCGVASTGIWLVMSNMGDLKLDILSSFSQNVIIYLTLIYLFDIFNIFLTHILIFFYLYFSYFYSFLSYFSPFI